MGLIAILFVLVLCPKSRAAKRCSTHSGMTSERFLLFFTKNIDKTLRVIYNKFAITKNPNRLLRNDFGQSSEDSGNFTWHVL